MVIECNTSTGTSEKKTRNNVLNDIDCLKLTYASQLKDQVMDFPFSF